VIDGEAWFRIAPESWFSLRRYPRVFYRAFAYTTADAAEPTEATLADAAHEAAPWVAIGGVRPRAQPFIQNLSADLQWLRVDGNRIVDEDGKLVVLRGINRAGLESSDRLALDPLGIERFRSLEATGMDKPELRQIVHDWKANVVRLTINQRWVLERVDYLAGLDRAVFLAASEGAYTILALQGRDETALGSTPAAFPDEVTEAAVRALAARYAYQPAVILDLYDRPRPLDADDLSLTFTWRATAADWILKWGEWAERLERAAHREHPRALLLVSGFPDGRSLRSFPLERVGGEPLPNVVYAASALDPADGAFEYDWATWTLARRHPIFVSAWGAEPTNAARRGWLGALTQTLRKLAQFDSDGTWRGLAGWTAAAWGARPDLVVQTEELQLDGRVLHRYDGAPGQRVATPLGDLVRGQLAQPVTTAIPAAREVRPALEPIAVAKGVGTGQQNDVADLRVVQDRLRELRYLGGPQPALPDSRRVPEADLAGTIAAIQRLQADFALKTTGGFKAGAPEVDVLNRALPIPNAEERTAVQAARAEVVPRRVQGLSIGRGVGNYTAAQLQANPANLPVDVRRVQERLVERRWLAASHTERPADGAVAPVPASALTATIAAITKFQREEVTPWLKKEIEPGVTLTGTVKTGKIEPGDATQKFLDDVITWHVSIAGRDLVFQDHPKPWAYAMPHPQGTSYPGAARPTVAQDEAAGLTTAQAKALVAVSKFEGAYEALNTFDIALVSFGLLQFAAGRGRGLGVLLARIKGRDPAVFHELFGRYGIEVEYLVADGATVRERPRWPTLACVADPAAADPVLRGPKPGEPRKVLGDAEKPVSDDPRLWGVLVRAGLDPRCQALQAETAAEEYVKTCLAAVATYTKPGGAETSAPVGELLRSETGIAFAVDRGVQENPMPREPGVRRIIAALRTVATRHALDDIRDVTAHEGEVLQQVIADLRADAVIRSDVDAAVAALSTLRKNASAANAQSATLLASAELTTARTKFADADVHVLAKSLVLPAEAGGFVTSPDTLHAAFAAATAALKFTPTPTAAQIAAAAKAQAAALGSLFSAQATPAALNAIVDARLSKLLADTDLAGP
jgi:hypothetical protein